MKHKHAELIHAWADGAVIERLWSDPHYNDQAWLIDKEPDWSEYCEYRIKTDVNPDEDVYFLHIYRNASAGKVWIDRMPLTNAGMGNAWVYIGKIKAEK